MLSGPQYKIGIGVHIGDMIFGTVGENNRMESTVISDAVNLLYAANRLKNESFFELKKSA